MQGRRYPTRRAQPTFSSKPSFLLELRAARSSFRQNPVERTRPIHAYMRLRFMMSFSFRELESAMISAWVDEEELDPAT
jgi:hypothetical protein